MGWLPAATGYEVGLSGTKVVCRTERGRQLKRLPKQLKDNPAVVGLRQLAEWLTRHQAACRSEVERWMVGTLPVPTAVVRSVWPDPAWQAALRDLVVTTAGDESGAGFLREADPVRGIGVVDLDGESAWWTTAQLCIPHPVHLTELDELREFAADLGVRQTTLQLFREVWHKPDRPEEQAAALVRYAGGRFAQQRHLLGRTTSLGYQVSGGYALCRIRERGRAVCATIWIGAGEPEAEAETGDLSFTDAHGAVLPAAEVPPVAWSEGVRMAAALYAGRVAEQAAP